MSNQLRGGFCQIIKIHKRDKFKNEKEDVDNQYKYSRWRVITKLVSLQLELFIYCLLFETKIYAFPMCLKRVFNPIPLSVPPPYILELRVSQAFPSCCVWVLTYYRKNKNMDSKKKHLFVLNLIHITNVHVIT